MAKITFIDPDGKAYTVTGQNGQSVMEVAIKNDISGIPGECGGACSCATCHVYVAKEWTEKVGKGDEAEEDMLDFAFEVRDNSRLSCQIRVSDELDGLEVEIPKEQF